MPLLEGEREDVVLAEKLHYIPGEFARLVDRGGPGRDALCRQLPDELPELMLLLAERLVRHVTSIVVTAP